MAGRPEPRMVADVPVSLRRAGFVTQGYREGLAEADIMRHTGHKSRTVMGKYRREGERFLTNFSAKEGL